MEVGADESGEGEGLGGEGGEVSKVGELKR